VLKLWNNQQRSWQKENELSEKTPFTPSASLLFSASIHTSSALTTCPFVLFFLQAPSIIMSTKVFVGNLAFKTKEADLGKEFEAAGNV
jgi:hypothetical protein